MQTPAPVDYARAHSVEEALELLERYGPESRLIAGGHSLIPMMRLRIAQPERVIDINDLTELDYIRLVASKPDLYGGSSYLAIGALTRHKSILASAVIGEHYKILHDAENVIADPIVRNRGTIGGSLCQADPAEDLSAVAAALRADVVLRSSAGSRVVPAREFTDGPYDTVLEDAEMLVEVRIPIRPGSGSAYEKVERRAGDWAVASAGAAVWLEGPAESGNAVIADVRVGLAAVGPYPVGLPEVAEALRGQPPSDELYVRAGAIAARSCRPAADQRGSVEYKRHLAGELTRRTLRRAVERITGDS